MSALPCWVRTSGARSLVSSLTVGVWRSMIISELEMQPSRCSQGPCRNVFHDFFTPCFAQNSFRAVSFKALDTNSFGALYMSITGGWWQEQGTRHSLFVSHKELKDCGLGMTQGWAKAGGIESGEIFRKLHSKHVKIAMMSVSGFQ